MSLLKKLFATKDNNVKYSLVDYNKYFESKFIDDTQIDLFHLGELNFPTGQIIACDPLVSLYKAKPLSKKVAPGIYSVIACIAKTNSGDRYAIAKLQFSLKEAMRWEMALIEGQNIKELKNDDDFFGFGVDAGLGCFCDVETQRWYNTWDDDFIKKNPGGNVYDDFLADEFKKNAKDPDDVNDVGDWLNFKIPNHSDLNIIMCSSGFGDGVYPCYWGLSVEGDICSLIIDFQVFSV